MSENSLFLKRIYQDEVQTLGSLEVLNEGSLVESFASLELPWKDNQRQVSCIPTGNYKVTKEVHAKFGKCLRIHDVEGRSGILVHVGNFYTQILGCILPGMFFTDINEDSHNDVAQSRKAMDRIYDLLPDTTTITITDP